MTVDRSAFIHPTAAVDDGASIGAGTKVWHLAHLRSGARVGSECILGKGVYVGDGVVIGDRCKVENYALLFEGLTVGDGVFIGPAVVFANDLRPRAVTPEGELRTIDDWEMSETVVEGGASIGARAVIVPPRRIGAWSMVAAGAVVTRDVPPHALVAGVPTKVVGWVCWCGQKVSPDGSCPACGRRVEIPAALQPAPVPVEEIVEAPLEADLGIPVQRADF